MSVDSIAPSYFEPPSAMKRSANVRAMMACALSASCVLPFAVHRFLSAELARGRTLGRAYLGAEAQCLAAEMAAARTLTPPTAGRRLPVRVAVVDAQGRTDDHHPFPSDARRHLFWK